MHKKYDTYSADEWRQIMTDFAASDLTQRQFCQQQGLTPSTFSKWRKQLGLIGSDRASSALAMPPDFQPLVPTALSAINTTTVSSVRAEPAWSVELALGNGMILRIATAE